MRRLLIILILSLTTCLSMAAPAASRLQISEFAAGGHQGVLDEDGDTPDWIEIRNTSPETVNLDGWTLSDGSKKRAPWRFPAGTMPGGGHLVVLASGKNRAVAGRLLHTDFKLKAKDGSIILRGPTGETSSIEDYPPQVAGVTFGLATGMEAGGDRRVLVGPDAALRLYLPTSDQLGRSWLNRAFDDSRWRKGRNGVGYAAKTAAYRDLLRSDLGNLMQGRLTSVYLRIPIVLTNPPPTAGVEMEVLYDDGFVAWLNGVEVARRNAPDGLGYSSVATAVRGDEDGTTPDRLQLPADKLRWVSGTNWLAVQVLNASPESSDLLFRVVLDAPNPVVASAPVKEVACRYLRKATPGQSNSGALTIGPVIRAVDHAPSGRQPNADEPILITAKVDQGAGAIQVVLRHKLMYGNEVEIPMFDDGQHGDGKAGDGVYGAAIPAKTGRPGQMIRYCVQATDGAGRVSRWPLFANRRDFSGYQGTVFVDSSVQSRLPLVQVFSQGDRHEDLDSDGQGGVSMFLAGEFYDNVNLSQHGQISRGFPKRSYNVEAPFDHHFRFATNQPRVGGFKLLGNHADKSKVRNTISYETIAAAGSVAHLAFPVRVQKNGRFYSVAEVVEKGDERWLERVGRDPHGDLYKMYDSLNGSGSTEKKTGGDDNRGLFTFISAFSDGRPMPQRTAYAWDHLDLAQCTAYFSSLALIASADHGHKNFYLYCDSRRSGEWALLPWDVDLSWGRMFTGHYFDDTLYGDTPLNFYRGEPSRARNRLYKFFFQYPPFRQMYLRRLRTIMDELLLPPGTPASELVLEKRIRELTERIDPPGVKDSDADLDKNAWPSWGNDAPMRSEAQRIISEYLSRRRKFLFKDPDATLFGEGIPPSQPTDVKLGIGDVDAGPGAATQFVCVTNTNNIAVDVTGWRLSGAGIDHYFRPGTVIPAGYGIYVAANVAAFRARTSGPRGGQSLYAQGNWHGSLQPGKGPLQLTDPKGRVVATQAVSVSGR